MRLQLKTIPDCNYSIHNNQGLHPHVPKALRSMSLEEKGGGGEREREREREEKRVFLGLGGVTYDRFRESTYACGGFKIGKVMILRFIMVRKRLIDRVCKLN